jgi:hypothetical protein
LKNLRVRNVVARLKGHKSQPFHIVFEKWPVTVWRGSPPVEHEATVGVWIDMGMLEKLARRAATNQSRKSQDGALHVEVHYITEVKG